tara:strand:+ start:380 stop:682 length:303 start_codon:yes stop_codon:yes gene_type:complete
MNIEKELADLKENILKITSLYGTTGNNQKRELQSSFNKLEEAISVTRCCTELKDKEAITFEEWKKENVVEENVCNEYLYKYGGWFDADDLLNIYKKDINL